MSRKVASKSGEVLKTKLYLDTVGGGGGGALKYSCHGLIIVSYTAGFHNLGLWNYEPLGYCIECGAIVWEKFEIKDGNNNMKNV